MSRRRQRDSVAPEEVALPAGSLWHRMPWIGLGLGVAGLAAAWLLSGGERAQFYFSWLTSYAFFLSIALGGLFFVLAHYASKAGWSVAVRRVAEHAMATLPLFVLLFVPVLFGMHDLYHWTHAEAVAHDHLLQAKRPYLNETFFLVRAALYFVLWVALALHFSRRSRAQDATGDHATTRRLQGLSYPAIAVFAVTTSFAAIDWLMSLDPHWYSTIFGVYFFSGSVVAIYAFMIVVLATLRRAGALRGLITVDHLHDLGKLLWAFTVFWTYIAFSQFFLIWYANIPEETLWYIHRMEGSWLGVSRLLAVGHFVVPFFFLMSHKMKRSRWLTVGALWMLAMHFVDIYWLVMPTLHREGAHFGLVDAAALVSVGGFFLAGFARALRGAALLPLRDPRLPESLSFENI